MPRFRTLASLLLIALTTALMACATPADDDLAFVDDVTVDRATAHSALLAKLEEARRAGVSNWTNIDMYDVPQGGLGGYVNRSVAEWGPPLTKTEAFLTAFAMGSLSYSPVPDRVQLIADDAGVHVYWRDGGQVIGSIGIHLASDRFSFDESEPRVVDGALRAFTSVGINVRPGEQ